MNNSITGIILAGGKSSRMGTDKALLTINNISFIQNSIKLLKNFCTEIIVSSNKNLCLNEAKVIADIYPDIGPLGGIYSCLQNSKSIKNIVLSCDMPNISVELIAYLLKHSEKFDIVVPENEEKKIEPLCGVYSKKILPFLKEYITLGRKAVHTFINEYESKLIITVNQKESFYSNSLFLNINTNEEYQSYLSTLKK